MTKTLTIDEQTYKRLASIRSDISHEKKRDIDFGDVINELINVYHDYLAFSGENAGG
jgi:predicted CopG family antitoxin